jgi:hypothetical protein
MDGGACVVADCELDVSDAPNLLPAARQVPQKNGDVVVAFWLGVTARREP